MDSAEYWANQCGKTRAEAMEFHRQAEFWRKETQFLWERVYQLKREVGNLRAKYEPEAEGVEQDA